MHTNRDLYKVWLGFQREEDGGGVEERPLTAELMLNPQLYTVIYCRACRPGCLWSAPKCQINDNFNEKEKISIHAFHDNRQHLVTEKSDSLSLRYADWNIKLLMTASFLVSRWSHSQENQFGSIMLSINCGRAIMMFYTWVCVWAAACGGVGWNNVPPSWFITF